MGLRSADRYPPLFLEATQNLKDETRALQKELDKRDPEGDVQL